jgi:hypothetical protein
MPTLHPVDWAIVIHRRFNSRAPARRALSATPGGAIAGLWRVVATL